MTTGYLPLSLDHIRSVLTAGCQRFGRALDYVDVAEMSGLTNQRQKAPSFRSGMNGASLTLG